MSYGFRHAKSSSTSSSMSRTSSRSTSTGTPPQTPTIRVTSPVPDAIGVIDIWDPEILSDPEEPQAQSVKTYSFRYSDDKKRNKSGNRNRKQRESAKSDRQRQTTWADCAIQSEDQSGPLLPAQQPPDDDGSKAAESDGSDAEETSQISAVTQVPLDGAGKSANGATQPGGAEQIADADAVADAVADPVAAAAAAAAPASDEKPVKKVQFNRSLSLVPTTGPLLPGTKGAERKGAGRRYSSLDGAPASCVPIDLFPLSDEQPVPVTSGIKVLSPTPESALENDQSPIQDNDPAPGGQESTDQRIVAILPPAAVGLTQLSVTIEEAPDDEHGAEQHHPSCDLFDRLQEHKNDEELMDVATDFVMQLLRSAQEEALRRGHQVQSKIDQKSKLSLELQHVAGPKSRNSRKWYRRLRSLLLRTLTCTCVPTHPNIQSPLSN